MIPRLAESAPCATLTTEAPTIHRVEVNELVDLAIDNGWTTVLIFDLAVMRYRTADRQARKYAAVQLLEVELVTMAEAVTGFGIPRSTLCDARKCFQAEGMRGLIPAKSGPTEAWKLVTRARRLILDTVYQHPDWTMPQVTAHVNQQLEEEGLATLSQRHIRRFLTYCGLLPHQAVVEQTAEVCPDAETAVNTLSVFVEHETFPGQEAITVSQDETDSSQPCPAVGAQTGTASYTAADRRYLARLRMGIDIVFGGGFLVVPFLMLIQFPWLMTRQLSGAPQGYYSLVQMALTFFYLALFGLPSLEMVKMLVKSEFGVLLGRRRSPGLTKLRSFLKAVGKLARAEALALAAACLLIQAGVVDWQILFIDGHFIPYYGRHRLRKGYFTTHRLAIKGNEVYYANDQQGRPLFFLFTPASASLIAVLPDIVDKVKLIAGHKWVAWCLTLIFDRGGFCAELFKRLDALQVHWITWLKASREVWEQVYQVEEEQFQLALLRLKSRKVKVKLYEWQVDIPGYGSCRAIILLDLSTNKRMVIITNDRTRSMRDVAQLMLQRWSQENFFKVMMARYNLDYTPGHYFEVAQEDPQVDNPRIKELRGLKKRLQTMKRKLESELGQRLLTRSRDQATLKQLKDAHHKKVRTIKSLDRQIERVKDELAHTPAKVPLSQARGQKHEVSNLERKTFFDVMKELAFNAEEWLLERLIPHYQGKDVRQALLQILFRGAVVQLVDDVLHVRLKPFDSPKVQVAAEALCRELTALQPSTLDKFRFPIVYEVLPAT